jgi:anti-anti-sigma factor
MQSLHIRVDYLATIPVLRLAGALDPTNSPILTAWLQQYLRDCRQAGVAPQIVLDGRQLAYIGSCELRALQELAQLARAQHGDLKCAGFSATVEQVATLLAGGDAPEFHPSPEAAVASFGCLSV